MEARLASGMVAAALIRRVHDAGGFAAVRARGDAESGAFLLIALGRDGSVRLYERGLVGPEGRRALIDSTPVVSGSDAIESYWRKRRERDPDLWVIELDIPEAERFAAETIL